MGFIVYVCSKRHDVTINNVATAYASQLHQLLKLDMHDT